MSQLSFRKPETQNRPSLTFAVFVRDSTAPTQLGGRDLAASCFS